MKVRIGNRVVGQGERVYIVAEAGSNHNGDLAQAMCLIDVAAEAGADAVKFQTFKAAHMYPRSAGESDYLQIRRPIYDIIRDMEMVEKWIPLLAAHCRERRIEFVSTPFDEESADLLNPYVNVFKIASYELTHSPLLRHVARLGKPIVLSTGASTLAEIAGAVEVIRAEGNREIVVLQCTAKYPAPLQTINVAAMLDLRRATNLPVGLSDHSRDPVIAPVAATALGACLIEKHFTLNNDLPGPDHRFAVEPGELRELVQSVRKTEQVIGKETKGVLDEELELHAFARRSIFTTRAIKAGELLSKDNLAVLRCGKLGFGLSPDNLESILGRTAVRDLGPDTPVRLQDLR